MKYLMKMTMAGAFVAALGLSVSSASAISVTSAAGFEAFGVTGTAVPLLGTTEVNNLPINTGDVYATFVSSGDDYTKLAYKFYNGGVPTLSTTVRVTYNDETNSGAFETYWATDTTGSAASKLTGPDNIMHNAYMDTIDFATGSGAYLVILFKTAFDTNFLSSVTLGLTVTEGGEGGIDAPTVPLPPSMVLFGTGLLGLGFLSARRRRKATSV